MFKFCVERKELYISYLFYFTLVSTTHVETPIFCFVLEKRIEIARLLTKLCTTREQIKFRECSVPFGPEFWFTRLLSKSDTIMWVLPVI